MKRLEESEKNADTGKGEQLSLEQSFEQAFESTAFLRGSARHECTYSFSSRGPVLDFGSTVYFDAPSF
ncbi:hypothetical protein EVAR_9818_1 [Eumeta japonica]|uniref:Uncharacterized protein n=1 Tax=Eumeta variegata TaxID=151549 RepID=A0A4C1U5H2_EUMVA|nr:hypothetical protein EVAR_9818_1 [Eumeta japonica]